MRIEPRRLPNRRRRWTNAAAVCRAELDGDRSVVVHHRDAKHWQQGDRAVGGARQRVTALDAESGCEITPITPGNVRLRDASARPSPHYRRRSGAAGLSGSRFGLRAKVEQGILTRKSQCRGEILLVAQLGDAVQTERREIRVAADGTEIGR